MDIHINFWAVLLAAAAYFLIGWLWYSALFGKMFMKLTGMDKLSKREKEKMMKAAMPSFGMAFAASLLTAYCLAHSVVSGASFYHVSGAPAGLMAGFWTWLGFLVTTHLNAVLWDRQPLKLYFLHMGYYLVSFLVMGMILALMP